MSDWLTVQGNMKLSLLLLVFLSGCIGAGVVLPSKQSAESRFRTKSELKESSSYRFQEPSTLVSGEGEVWRFDQGKDWCGAWMLVPLLLPVCEKYEEYTFKDEQVVKYQRKRTRLWGIACSIFPTCERGRNCKLCITE